MERACGDRSRAESRQRVSFGGAARRYRKGLSLWCHADWKLGKFGEGWSPDGRLIRCHGGGRRRTAHSMAARGSLRRGTESRGRRASSEGLAVDRMKNSERSSSQRNLRPAGRAGLREASVVSGRGVRNWQGMEKEGGLANPYADMQTSGSSDATSLCVTHKLHGQRFPAPGRARREPAAYGVAGGAAGRGAVCRDSLMRFGLLDTAFHGEG